MWNEFKEFALKGNALSLAIGVIIGAAFGKIVDALVNDIIMPIVGIAGKGRLLQLLRSRFRARSPRPTSRMRESRAAFSPTVISSAW